MSNIAFLGLGIMGSPMAVHLQNAGHQVSGYNPSPEKAKPLTEAGGRAAESIADAVADADVVCVMVPDSPQVQDVLAGEGGVVASAKPGTLVIDFSSIRPDVTVELAKQAREKGFRLLDAPVSGGEAGAKNARSRSSRRRRAGARRRRRRPPPSTRRRCARSSSSSPAGGCHPTCASAKACTSLLRSARAGCRAAAGSASSSGLPATGSRPCLCTPHSAPARGCRR